MDEQKQPAIESEDDKLSNKDEIRPDLISGLRLSDPATYEDKQKVDKEYQRLEKRQRQLEGWLLELQKEEAALQQALEHVAASTAKKQYEAASYPIKSTRGDTTVLPKENAATVTNRRLPPAARSRQAIDRLAQALLKDDDDDDSSSDGFGG